MLRTPSTPNHRTNAPANLRRIIGGIAAALALTSALVASEPEPGSYAASIERLEPFDTAGLDSGVAQVLRNYYTRTFTDADTWAAAESLRFDGSLHFPEGSVPFTAFKKKPDLMKVTMNLSNGHRIIMAHDGSEAWQLNTRRSPYAANMPPDEARNFIRDATTGGHLLYPGIEGKTIELLGTVPTHGQRAYELRITLPDGQVIRSFLDMISFAEVQQITVNNVSGDTERTVYEAFRMVEGVRVPFRSTLFIDGEEIHQSRIREVNVNQGATPWMFRRPPGAAEAAAPAEEGGDCDANHLNSDSPDGTEAPSFFDFEIEE